MSRWEAGAKPAEHRVCVCERGNNSPCLGDWDWWGSALPTWEDARVDIPCPVPSLPSLQPGTSPWGCK